MSDPIDRDFMESLGFLEDGDGNDELGLTILGEGVTEWDGDEPAHQLIWNATDGSLFLEAFSADADSLAITEIPKPTSREKMVELLKLLGAYRPTLHDHVSRELKKYLLFYDPPEDIGQAIINFVVEHELMESYCPDSPGSQVVTVWSANAPEQITQYIKEYQRTEKEADPLGG